ncbi:MAG: hypothetical protein AAGI52_04420 [Bacteroidota bacterium]
MHRLLLATALVALIALASPTAAQPSPAPTFMSLLEAPNSAHWSNGKFWLFNQYHFAFLPNADGYSPYRDGPKMEMRYLRDGTEVARHGVDTRPYSGPIQSASDSDGIDLNETGAGDYAVEWLIDGESFYRFPFTVEALTSDDPYASGTKWAVDGAWSEYLIIKVPRPNVTGPITLMFYDREKAYERTRGNDRGVLVQVDRDGEPTWRIPDNEWYYDRGPNYEDIDLGVGGASFEAFPWWNLVEVTPVTYHSEMGAFDEWEHTGVNIEPSMMEDGSYTATVEIFSHADVEGEPTVSNIRSNVISTRTASFEIRDGAVVMQGLQAPSADPMTRIEGIQEDLNYVYHFIPWNGTAMGG